MGPKTRAVANWFILRGREKRTPVSLMKLQKLMYYAHGWAMAINDAPLLDEDVEAWDHGPVVFSVYKKADTFGSAPITSPIGDGLDIELSSDEVDVLEQVWDKYGALTAAQLRAMTHEPGTPWSDHYMRGAHRKTIPDDSIRAWFVERYAIGVG